jgi:hypothetical protein
METDFASSHLRPTFRPAHMDVAHCPFHLTNTGSYRHLSSLVPSCPQRISLLPRKERKKHEGMQDSLRNCYEVGGLESNVRFA